MKAEALHMSWAFSLLAISIIHIVHAIRFEMAKENPELQKGDG
jgi:hypothetical protein